MIADSIKCTKGLWAVEWNETQKQFHIDIAENLFTKNIDAFLNKEPTEPWIMLCIFNSYAEAEKFVCELRQERRVDAVIQ
jgi:hypothetical protein